ncbi:MAG: dependent epimerase/dehydratase family [Moraxellaceae bacterium]|jgi:short-subunit dehydrogenase|nr:dependent epimerase/dehydratase family [Moraxellaceae bacterium]
MYQDKVVWITGASSGIGEGLAFEFARQGARVVLSARRIEALEAVRQQCAQPERHLVLPMDMTRIDEFPAHVAAVLAKFGRIDVLVNNAGISQRSLVKDTALEVDRQIMEVDFFAPVALTKAVLPHMLQASSGQLVVVSSVVGLVATPWRSAYAAAKHAIAGFYDALRAEVHADGIQVAVVYPGFVRTNVSQSALRGDGSLHGRLDTKIASAMTPTEFAGKAVAALGRGEDRIIIAGREKIAVWLGRLSPALLARLIRKLEVT